MGFLDLGLSDIIGGVGGYLQGRSASKEKQKERDFQSQALQQQRDDQMRQLMAKFLEDQKSQNIAATQLDPYKQAKSLNGANVRRSFDPNAGANSNFDLSALSPGALATAKGGFDAAVNTPATDTRISDYLSQVGAPTAQDTAAAAEAARRKKKLDDVNGGKMFGGGFATLAGR